MFTIYDELKENNLHIKFIISSTVNIFGLIEIHVMEILLLQNVINNYTF